MFKNFSFLFLLSFFLLFESVSASTCLEKIENIYRQNSNPEISINYEINIDKAISRVEKLVEANKDRVTKTVVGVNNGEDLVRIHIKSHSNSPAVKVLLLAGVHGDESGGVGTLIDFLERNINNSFYSQNFEFVVYPYVNLEGLRRNQRRLLDGTDLNRSMNSEESVPLADLLENSLLGETFDISLDLHEAKKKFHFYSIKAFEEDGSLTQKVLSKISDEHLYKSPNEKYPYLVPMTTNPDKHSYVLYSPGETRSLSTGSHTVKSFVAENLDVKYSYTLEGPGQMDIAKKIPIYRMIVENYLIEILKRFQPIK